MRARALTAVGTVVVAALAASPVAAKTTKNFSFHSNGTAINPQATGSETDPTTYEDFPFTIKQDEKNGTINAHVDWTSPADDWDLYVYRRGPGGKLQTIGQSASAPPGNEENAVADSQGIPWRAGQYVVRVVNYTAIVPSFQGTVRFGPFEPYNQIPIARLKAPKHVKAGKRVKLDASKSRDPDGRIVNYAFDLDGNGSMEVNNGDRPILRRVLKPGVHHLAVRVTDGKGLRAFANRTVVVGKQK